MSRWIKSFCAIESNPKVRHLAVLLNRDLDGAIGLLHRFWWATIEHCPSGVFHGWSLLRIGLLVSSSKKEAEAIVNALLEARLLDDKPYRVHDWLDCARENLYDKYFRDRGKLQEIEAQWASFGPTMPPVAPMPPPKETTEQQPEKKERKKSDYQVLLEAFAENRGIIPENQGQWTILFKSHGKSAKEHLAACGGNIDEAIRSMLEIAAYIDEEAAKKGFVWSHYAMVNRYYLEWKQERRNSAPKMPETSEEPFLEVKDEAGKAVE